MTVKALDLTDQVALVTGASRGIGAAIAKRLAEAGATVILNYKSNRAAVEGVLSEIKNISPRSLVMGFDVALQDQVDKAIDEITTQFGRLDVLVCNAGISRDVLLPRVSGELFLDVLNTNLMGSVFPTRAVSRPMMRARYGRIVLISSVVGETGNKGQSPYAASKAALFGFSKSVAQELASRGITCNVVCPGFIETEMTATLEEGTKKTYFDRIPAGRFGSGREIADAVLFLASKEAAYITGSTLDVNGGLLMR